jgi:DNA-binding transcriptional regulator YhcF (GntR family)
VENKDKKIINLQVDAKSALPVYEQIKRAIKLAILSDHLEEGEQLMSIRELALKLQVNPNTIIKVYYQLEVEGFIYSRPGAGYYVKLDRKKIQKEKNELFRNITNDYISKVLAMGYSIDDTIKELSRKISQNN